MTRQQPDLGDDSQIIENRLYDAQGQLAFEIRAGEYTTYNLDGSSITKKSYQGIGLVCGSVYQGGSKMLLAICEDCRYPPYRFPWRYKPRHGVFNQKLGHRCAGHHCGKQLCPRDAIRYHHHYYCLSCFRKERIKTWFLKIFTSTKE